MRFAGKCLIGLVMLFLLAAAVGKMIDPGTFRESLDTWILLPHAMRDPLALVLPIFEFSLAVAWLFGFYRDWSVVSVAVLLILFTTAFGLHVALGREPQCECLGEWMAFDRLQIVSYNLFTRNGVLLGLLAIGTALQFWGTEHRVRTLGSRLLASHHRPARSGFTLLETLLGIALIALLISLMAPHLAGVRDRARGISSLGQLRSHGQVLQLYSSNYRGYYPIYTTPDGPTKIKGADREFVAEYFFERFLWDFALADEYYDGSIGHPSFFPPGYKYAGSPYVFTVSYMAVPDFWNQSTRTGPEQWRGVPADRTLWPSAKGILVSHAAAYVDYALLDFQPDTPQETAFADGSARTIRHGDFVRPIGTGEGRWPGRTTVPFGLPVIHTLDGALGRDVR